MRHPATYEKHVGKIPHYVWMDGRKCYSVPQLARLRRVSTWAARKWAKRRRHTIVGGHLFCALDAPLLNWKRGGEKRVE
jgi:hypothetical protein